MTKKSLKILEFSLAGFIFLALLGGTGYLAVSNIKNAQETASRLAARAYLDEYKSMCANVEVQYPFYYNDGHLYWVIDEEGNITPDEEHHEITPQTCNAG